VSLPPQAKRWYRGTRVAKIEVRGTDVPALVQTVRAIRRRDSSGTAVLIAASGDVTAERTLQVAAALAAAEGPASQERLSEVFPGQVCADEDPSFESEGCRSLFPVLLPEVEVPSPSGLTEEPVERARPAPRPRPEAAPQPAPQPSPDVSCDRGHIRQVIRQRRGAFKFCYERRLQMNQDLEGRVSVRFRIGSDGAVRSASSSGNMPDQRVHECVVNQIKRLRFQPPEGGGSCTIRYPFTFAP